MATMTVNGVRIGISHRFLLQKLVYFSKEKGYCYAMNEYLGEVVGLSKSRISHLLSDLRKAKLIDILLIYDAKHSMQVVGRRIAVLGHARGIATNSKVRNEDCSSNNNTEDKVVDNSNDIKKATTILPLAEVCKHGSAMGIPVNVIMVAAGKYGITNVRNALAICAASKSVRKMVAYFWAALKGKFKPNKQAEQLKGKYVKRSTFKTTLKPDLSNEYKNTPKPTAATNEFLRDFLKSHDNASAPLVNMM